MNPNALTEEQFATIIGRTAEDVRSFVRAGLTKNADGTFSLTACIAWKFLYDWKNDTGFQLPAVDRCGAVDQFDTARRSRNLLKE